MSVTATLDRLNNKIEQIKKNPARLGPGQPYTIPTSWTPCDACAQGDLNITIRDEKDIPKDYVEVQMKQEDLQLVPGNNEGARHVLDSMDGVKMYRHPQWNAESFEGPFCIFTKDRVVQHPKHGHVTIPAGFAAHFTYQVNLDLVEKIKRRNAD